MTGADVALAARTAVRLRPSQVAHRARLRAQRAALRRWPRAGRRLLAGPDPAGARGWPRGFAPLDARAGLGWPGLAGLAGGRIEALGIARDLGDPPDWEQAGAPRLWRFHLHYWDWAWGLAAEPDRAAARAAFAALWRSWRSAVTFGRGDAWLPYPAALRAWAWCGQHRPLVAGGELEREFTAELAAHCGFLRRHLEADVGGNHLIKNLKALAGLAVFFGDERLLRRALGRLAGQAAVQVLPDGGHYERAPAYHCQVLADLIDVAGLAAAAGIAAPSELAVLTGAIGRMRGWLGQVLLPGGQVPLLNDGYPVPAALVAACRPGPAPARPLVVLPGSGLARATAGGWHLLADVGAPCPDELPAHAHADTLGCLVHLDGAPLLVDTGTSGYEPGPVRSYERSTSAHSTVQVDGADSTEVWGAFRAGRRARVRDLTAREDAGRIIIEASHDGFRRLPGNPVHRRRWTLTARELLITDEVTGSGRHQVAATWHLSPGTLVRIEPDLAGRAAGGGAGVPWCRSAVLTAGGPGGPAVAVTLRASSPALLQAGSAPVASGFARTVPAPVLTCRVDAALPVQLEVRLRRVTGTGPGRPAGEAS